MFKKILCAFLTVTFSFTLITPIPKAQASSIPGLPQVGAMVNLSPAYQPLMLKGLTVDKDNPFKFDFLVDLGSTVITSDNSSVIARNEVTKQSLKEQQKELKNQTEKLVKYFLAALAVPQEDLWVNLSPYEKDKTVPEALGQTDMGRDLLAQDYVLKQLTASLIYPEKELGKKFWDKVYEKAQAQYGNVNIPVNTFNKVWILADKAEVYEHNQTAFVVDSHLKVMLEEDYLASRVIARSAATKQSLKEQPQNQVNQIIRDIIIPELEREVNQGKNFATLRQIVNSMILANWYKNNLKQALLTQAYANKNVVKGLEYKNSLNKQGRPGDIALAVSPSRLPSKQTVENESAPGKQPNDVEIIYQQYLAAYKKGVFNYIKEESANNHASLRGGQRPTKQSQQEQPTVRKYFSGGFGVSPQVQNPSLTKDIAKVTSAGLRMNQAMRATVQLNPTSDMAMQNRSVLALLVLIHYMLSGELKREDITDERRKEIENSLRKIRDLILDNQAMTSSTTTKPDAAMATLKNYQFLDKKFEDDTRRFIEEVTRVLYSFRIAHDAKAAIFDDRLVMQVPLNSFKQPIDFRKIESTMKLLQWPQNVKVKLYRNHLGITYIFQKDAAMRSIDKALLMGIVIMAIGGFLADNKDLYGEHGSHKINVDTSPSEQAARLHDAFSYRPGSLLEQKDYWIKLAKEGKVTEAAIKTFHLELMIDSGLVIGNNPYRPMLEQERKLIKEIVNINASAKVAQAAANKAMLASAPATTKPDTAMASAMSINHSARKRGPLTGINNLLNVRENRFLNILREKLNTSKGKSLDALTFKLLLSEAISTFYQGIITIDAVKELLPVENENPIDVLNITIDNTGSDIFFVFPNTSTPEIRRSIAQKTAGKWELRNQDVVIDLTRTFLTGFERKIFNKLASPAMRVFLENAYPSREFKEKVLSASTRASIRANVIRNLELSLERGRIFIVTRSRAHGDFLDIYKRMPEELKSVLTIRNFNLRQQTYSYNINGKSEKEAKRKHELLQWLIDNKKELLNVPEGSQAMISDEPKRGGIDLTVSKSNVRKEGLGVQFSVDSAMLERFKRDGINYLKPEIITITPVNIWPLLGLLPPKREDERLAGV